RFLNGFRPHLTSGVFDKANRRRQGIREAHPSQPPGAVVTTLLVSQRNFESHATPAGHPERPDRVRAIEEALGAEAFASLIRRDAPSADLNLAELVHAAGYL